MLMPPIPTQPVTRVIETVCKTNLLENSRLFVQTIHGPAKISTSIRLTLDMADKITSSNTAVLLEDKIMEPRRCNTLSKEADGGVKQTVTPRLGCQSSVVLSTNNIGDINTSVIYIHYGLSL